MRFTIPALLLASSLVTATALAAPPASADVHGTPFRISTGVVSARVLNAGDFIISSQALQSESAAMPEVQLALDVDQHGSPSNVQIVKSVNPKVDEQVLAAVRKFRFRPASLDEQPVPVKLSLTVLIRR